MNNDCFTSIFQFLPRADLINLIKLNTEFATKYFPKKIIIRTFDEALQFYNWCQAFDTSNLQEVTYKICDLRWDARVPEGVFIGWTPSTVKKLTVNVYNNFDFVIMDTIEDLTLDRASDVEFYIPDSVKRLCLEKRFNGRICSWSNSLEYLHIEAWPMPIEELDILDLPDGVREIYISYGVPVEVHVWPSELKKLTLIECDNDPVSSWFCIKHGEIPEGVEVIRFNVD